jgi:hypothetical protein
MQLRNLALAFLLVAPPIAASCVITTGCGMLGPHVTGSGVSKSETRTVGDFTKIGLEGSIDAEVEIGTPAKVEITSDDNLLAHIRTEVSGGKLVIGFENGSYDTKSKTFAHVVVPSLEGFAIAGSASGEIRGLNGGSFHTSIAGHGDVRTSGVVDELKVSIAGSGNVDASAVKSKRTKVDIAGSGSVKVDASETLDVSIAGSGDVFYRGDAKVKQSIAGSGSVKRLQ